MRLGEWKVPTTNIGGESKREDVGLQPVQDFELRNINFIRHKAGSLTFLLIVQPSLNPNLEICW